MLTPRFELSQDDDFLVLVIHAPFAKVSETEFFIEGEEIRFYSKPYYLRLHLPKPVKEDERTEAKYDVDKGCFTARISKMNRGEAFDGLDMLTKLLTPPGETSAACPKIEVNSCSLDEVSEQTGESCEGDTVSTADVMNPNCTEEEEEIDWYIEQEIPADTPENPITGAAKYGFASQRSGVFTKLMSEFSEILDVKDPDSLSAAEKRAQRLQHEAEHFSEDHYLADLFDSEEIACILAFQPWWAKLEESEATQVACPVRSEEIGSKETASHVKPKESTQVASSGSAAALQQQTQKRQPVKCELSDEEKDQLLKLPRKQFLIEKDALPSVYHSLVDIIFAYAYNHRVNFGEENVESGWTIAKLGATLSWLETFTSLKDVAVSCYRRVLTFPLYRSWDLCVQVWDDLSKLFSAGRLPLLKCLLDVHKSMIVSDPRYIFNDLYITDYCVWIQSADDKRLQSLAQKIKEVKLSKDGVGLDLQELESAAEMVLKEQSEAGVEAITAGVKSLGVKGSQPVLDSDDDEEEDDSDSDDDSEDETEESNGEDEEEEEQTDTVDTKSSDEISAEVQPVYNEHPEKT